ncbi:hypothetical protein [Iningainema tapete]|uniref:Uncharacterized protein n=1 Tax=Iningainema tapete BLCC-T55 TaxID=2748662 RepID=A0A8J6XLQ7_9CYAN|nr:hypothetical protein [Iningainema tapete]MBD2775136.1 hypothetical protein [Iningainema tapete BLCC-T55]
MSARNRYRQLIVSTVLLPSLLGLEIAVGANVSIKDTIPETVENSLISQAQENPNALDPEQAHIRELKKQKRRENMRRWNNRSRIFFRNQGRRLRRWGAGVINWSRRRWQKRNRNQNSSPIQQSR